MWPVSMHGIYMNLKMDMRSNLDSWRNLTYKVKSRPFKFHDSITVSQMLANLSGVEFKIIVPKF